MIIWINGAFGAGKTITAHQLNRRLPNSFIYDPENVGDFIWRNTNSLFSEGDFQDIPLWREMNYKMLRMISDKYDGIIIVPMTLVNPDYYNEIIGKLIVDGINVKHYILYVSREEITRRLNKRKNLRIRDETFALDNINRCVEAFDRYVTDVKIHTDNMSIASIAETIAALSNIDLSPRRRKYLISRKDIYPCNIE